MPFMDCPLCCIVLVMRAFCKTLHRNGRQQQQKADSSCLTCLAWHLTDACI
jgi:hypothetical protein